MEAACSAGGSNARPFASGQVGLRLCDAPIRGVERMWHAHVPAARDAHARMRASTVVWQVAPFERQVCVAASTSARPQHCLFT